MQKENSTTVLELTYDVEKDGTQFNLSAHEVIRDYQLNSKVLVPQGTKTFKEKSIDSNSYQLANSDKIMIVLEAQGHWYKLQDPETQNETYVPFHWVKRNLQDRGYFFTTKDETVYQSPDHKSTLITTLGQGTLINSYRLKKDWIQILIRGQLGYVHTNTLTHLSDFALWGYHEKLKWISISHRENEMIITKDQKKIPLQDFLAFKTDEQKAIALKSTTLSGITIPLRSHLKIINQKSQTWIQSQISGHGTVWWKKESTPFVVSNLLDSKNETPEVISSEELQKRKIFSVAFDKKNLTKGIVSSDGVFTTEDGKTWTKISMFTDKNYPVSIHPEGVWFVGPYRSTDGGKIFEPFIRWEQLALTLQTRLHMPPLYIKIKKIETKPQSQVVIQVDTGISKIKLQSHMLGNNWRVVD